MDRAQKFAGRLLYDGRSSADVSHGATYALMESSVDHVATREGGR